MTRNGPGLCGVAGVRKESELSGLKRLGLGNEDAITPDFQKLIATNSGDTLLPAILAGVGPRDRVAISVVRDSKSGDVIVKIVNGEDHPISANIDLASVTAAGRQLIATVLTGTNADVVNEDGKPAVALPVVEETRVGSKFERVLPVNSLTVLRLR